MLCAVPASPLPFLQPDAIAPGPEPLAAWMIAEMVPAVSGQRRRIGLAGQHDSHPIRATPGVLTKNPPNTNHAKSIVVVAR